MCFNIFLILSIIILTILSIYLKNKTDGSISKQLLVYKNNTNNQFFQNLRTKKINKVLFIYWAQKFENTPDIVKKCLLSWKLNNPTWKIIELDDDNLSEYINIEEEIPDIKTKKITKTSYSDIVRIFLLEKYGGVWCDATMFCNQSLDIWLNKNTSTGFFAFNKPGGNRLLSSWFLYSEENHYITKKWKEMTIEYWKNHNKMHHYFWFHFLFGDLYNSDNKFKKLWDLTPKISADGPHYILFNGGLTGQLSDKIKNHINKVKIPCYKLSYKYNKRKYNDLCNLSYLMNTINIKFIHIGKCAGTTIVKQIPKLVEYHLLRNYKDNEKYIIWIRNPIERFVSAFNYVKNVINTDTSKFKKKKISLDNCLAPCKIIHKIKTGYAYSKQYDNLVNYFYTANELAESITSENIEKKQLALELMNSQHEHIFKGIGWYLYNGNFIENNHNKIIFVGTVENMTDDITELGNLLSIKIDNKKIIRKNTDKDEYLSPLAINNLKEYFKDTEYKTLQTLYNYGFIDKEYLDYCYTYKI